VLQTWAVPSSSSQGYERRRADCSHRHFQNSGAAGSGAKGITSRMLEMPVMNIQHAFEAQAEAGVWHSSIATQIRYHRNRRIHVVTPYVSSSISSRSSRWLPPTISPMPGTSKSMAATVLPSSFERSKNGLISFGKLKTVTGHLKCFSVAQRSCSDCRSLSVIDRETRIFSPLFFQSSTASV